MMELEYSGTLEMSDRVRQMSKQGVEIINFTGGTLDDTPLVVKEATKKAINDGLGSGLTDSAGLFELREAISTKLARDDSIYFDSMSQIIVTVGAKNAIFMAIQAAVKAGEEVLILDPFWPSYKPLVSLAGAVPKLISMEKGGNFGVDANKILRGIGPKSRMLILNTPHNPTGRVFTKREIEAVCDIAKEKNLILLSDESYRQAVYEDNRHYSIATFPGMKDRTIIVYSFSKSYTMYGWRVGFAAGNEQIISRMVRIQSNTVSCPTSFAQNGALAAFKYGEDHVTKSMERYRRLRDITVESLNQNSGVSCASPEGGFWVFPNVSKIATPSDSLVKYLLEENGIGVIPGSTFGESGLGHLRIWYLHDEEYLKKGLEKLRRAIDTFAGKPQRRERTLRSTAS